MMSMSEEFATYQANKREVGSTESQATTKDADDVQTAPTSVRKDEQSSRNKKLGPPTRWRSSKYFPSLIVKSCNSPLTHM